MTTLSDKHVLDHMEPSKCALRVKLRQANEPEGAPDAYQAVLDALTAELIERERTAYGAVDLSEGRADDRIAATKTEVESQTAALYRPLFQGEKKFGRKNCTLTAEPDFLVLADDGNYKIRICDSSRAVSDKDVPARLSFLALVYELAFGKKPAALEVIDGAGAVHAYANNTGHKKFLEIVDTVYAALTAKDEPYEPVGRSKCLTCTFHGRCWPRAVARNDVSLLRGVDQNLASALYKKGIRTVADVFEKYGDDVKALAKVERKWGFGTKAVGEKDAQTIVHFARAFVQKTAFLVKQLKLPSALNWVMFDLEGLPDKLDPNGPIYLWGLQVFGSDGADFTPALAPFAADGDKLGWEAFLNTADDIFKRYGDIPFVHWFRYEKVRLEAYIERFGDRDGIAARVLKNLFDLQKALEETLVIPVSSYSLKVVEELAGYKRTQEEFGTNLSIKLFIEARDTTDNAVREQRMTQLLKYNQEDLEAMWAVLRWVIERLPEWTAALESQGS